MQNEIKFFQAFKQYSGSDAVDMELPFNVQDV